MAGAIIILLAVLIWVMITLPERFARHRKRAEDEAKWTALNNRIQKEKEFEDGLEEIKSERFETDKKDGAGAGRFRYLLFFTTGESQNFALSEAEGRDLEDHFGVQAFGLKKELTPNSPAVAYGLGQTLEWINRHHLVLMENNRENLDKVNERRRRLREKIMGSEDSRFAVQDTTIKDQEVLWERREAKEQSSEPK
jgi:hypothetical protein